MGVLDTQVADATHAAPTAEALALRYRVYCEEFNYLPSASYPTGQESDGDDLRSAHFHAYDARSQAMGGSPALAGYARLVGPDAEGLLPVQRRCALALARGRLPDPRQAAEVSRLIIAPEYRRRRRDDPPASQPNRREQAATGQRPLPTDILLQLFRQMHEHSQSHGIRYWFAAMERPLARALSQMGFPFEAAGPEGEFFGRVTPYMVDLHDLQLRVAARQPQLASWLLTAAGNPHQPAESAARVRDGVWAHQPPPPQLWRAAC